MNTTTPRTIATGFLAPGSNALCLRLLEDTWITVIQEEIDAQPETLADIVEPSIMGQFDAQMRNACDPTKYYAKLGEIEAYLLAYMDTAAAMAILDADTDDYAADVDWREQARKGN